MGEIHQLSVDSQHYCVYIWERSTNYQWIPSMIVSIYGRDPPTISGFPALLCLYMGEIHQLSMDSQHYCVYIWERSTNYQWIPSMIVSIYGRDPPTISGFPAQMFSNAELCWIFVVFLNNQLNAQLLRCFRPWTFSLNIGLNMLPSDFILCLHSIPGYSTGEFQALQLIALAVFGDVD